MGRAEAFLFRDRIAVRTVRTPGIDDFSFMLAASKAVGGGSFNPTRKLWAYPLSVDTCKALRRAFGERLHVMPDLADWYRQAVREAAEHTELSVAEDVQLSARVPADFASWLRGYQRTGARWIAEGYRGCGLVADVPGLGKTPETLAALLEGDVQGPVLVVCPKPSVKSVWGVEARRWLPGVPIYLCRGTRERRTRMLTTFRRHMAADPNRLRVVVVVAEMLRTEMGDPCYTKGGKKIAGMCAQRRRNPDNSCALHIQDPKELEKQFEIFKDEKKRKKDLVPIGFSYPELFDDELLGGGWSWIVLDESHKLLGSLTIRKANLMGRGLKLLPERTRRRYGLTGTPFGKGGRLEGLFGTLHWLWPDEYKSFWKWARAVFEMEEVVIGYDKTTRSQKTIPRILGPKGMRLDATPEEESRAWEAFLASLGPRVLRRTKAEMLKELEPKTYVEVVCEMTVAQRKQHQELFDYAEISTADGPILANGHLALLTRNQQLANGCLTRGKDGKAQFTQDSGKLEQLWDKLDARGIIDGAPGDKLVIASRYNEFLDAISLMLAKDNVPSMRIDGATSETQRARCMALWQGNTCVERVMLVNVKAAGISINLDAADEMHIMDEDPDPGVNEQLEDRIHRASRMHKVVIHYYRTEGTTDYLAAHNVEYKRRLQHAVLDGRRGVEYQYKLVRDLLAEALQEA